MEKWRIKKYKQYFNDSEHFSQQRNCFFLSAVEMVRVTLSLGDYP